MVNLWEASSFVSKCRSIFWPNVDITFVRCSWVCLNQNSMQKLCLSAVSASYIKCAHVGAATPSAGAQNMTKAEKHNSY